MVDGKGHAPSLCCAIVDLRSNNKGSLHYANINGKKNFDGTYTITDSSFIQAIGELCRLDESFSSTVSSMTLALGENSLSLTGKTGFYGSCTIDFYDIGTTTLNFD